MTLDPFTNLVNAVSGQPGWDTKPETSPEDVRIWRSDGSAAVASSDSGRWVVLNSDGEPNATFAHLVDAVNFADL